MANIKRNIPLMKKGEFTIVNKNGFFGVIANDNELLIECLFPQAKWEGDYLCLHDGNHWGVVHISELYYLPHP